MKYVWTREKDAYLREHYDSRIRNRTLAIARVWGWPKWVITKRAQHLGLAVPTWRSERKPWTPEEIRFLETYAGRRHVDWIAKQLRRTETSVVVKLKRLEMSRTIDGGYTGRALALGFGVDEHVVIRWITRGWLQAERRGHRADEARAFVAYVVQPEAVRLFVQRHPNAFRLDKVDQIWFLDIVFNGSIGERAEAA